MRVSAGGRATAVVVARTVIRARTTHGDSPASGREASGAVVEEDGVATPCASRHAAHTRCLPSAHSARGVRCTCVVNDHVCAHAKRRLSAIGHGWSANQECGIVPVRRAHAR